MTDLSRRFRLGVDIGGTFTDVTLVNEASGEVVISKVSSTPADPSQGFIEAVRRILSLAHVAPAAVRYVVHGTTVATNSIIEGKGARTGFITTSGFQDMLEIARQTRPSLYDLRFEKPRPLVPRHLCFGISERLNARGQIITRLDEDAVRVAATQLRQDRVESIAVCFLHAYLNPAHERRAGEILRQVFPEALVSLSAEVAPEFREYTRASTTIINASIRPIIAGYLARIELQLRQAGFVAELLLMQSSGGVYSFAAAREKPVFMVESGPAAGITAATYLGTALGYSDILSFDMGGTTAKAGLILDGAPKVTKEYEVGSSAQAGQGSARGRGYPIRTPVIDLVEIGAGGGSIAWVDSGGALRVGPRSAGAEPGPACYAKGGTEPTITDANLVLGRLNPDYFLGGEIKLDAALAQAVIWKCCAEPLGLDVVTAAHSIVEIANAAMVNALRLVSVQHGHDPRDFTLIAFGGAGPVHANRLAAEMEIPRTLIPMSPGITSALGLLVTDLKHEFSTTLLERADRVNVTALDEIYQAMETEGRWTLAREGVRAEDMAFLRLLDARYVGQSYELPISFSTGPEPIRHITEQFHQTHQRVYGYSASEEQVEFVNVRLTATGKIPRPKLRELPAGQSDGVSAQKAARPVYFSEYGGLSPCPIYDRYLLAAGSQLAGPAIIEEFDSTTVIHPGYQAKVDQFGNMLLTARRGA